MHRPKLQGYRLRSLLRCGLLLLTASCGQETFSTAGERARPLSGQDGPLTVTQRGAIVNRYGELVADASVGAETLRVRSITPLQPLKAGDLLLIIQMQGASIDLSDSAAFGAVTSLGNAGRYEYTTVASVSGDTITLDKACGGLRNNYSAAGHVQVIRVPQLTTLRIASGASVTAPKWNGAVGGVVAIHVKETAQIDGSIDVNGAGFRGGTEDNYSASLASEGFINTIYRSNDRERGGEKGESIAGSALDLERMGARYGRGAPANGGGGGNSHNAGGGGGAGGMNGKPWSGQGVMDGSTGAAAWALDPAYRANGSKLTDSSGGGRGGYSFSKSKTAGDPDPTTTAPGSMNWGASDWRREVGGLGGRPLQSEVLGRLFLGGGGGAGDGNDGAVTGGGAGGGMVYLMADAVSGSGEISANGEWPGNTRPNHHDGAGGGGAGGTVVVIAGKIEGIRVNANGARGGDQLSNAELERRLEAEGPGGGGGGGYVALSTGSVTVSAVGGSNGTTRSASMAKFPQNGATSGATGQAGERAPMIAPVCQPGPQQGADLAIRVTPKIEGSRVTFSILVTNKGPLAVKGAPVRDEVVPSVLTDRRWSCSAGAGGACGAQGGASPLSTTVDLEAGGSVTFLVEGTLSLTSNQPVRYTGSIMPPPGISDPQLADNQATVVLTPDRPAGGGADLTIRVTWTPDPIREREPITYTISVSNSGPDPARDVRVDFTVPDGGTVESIRAEGWECRQMQNHIICTRESVYPGAAPDIVIRVLPKEGTEPVESAVEVVSGGEDPNPANNKVNVSVRRGGISLAGGGLTCSAGGSAAREGVLLGSLALLLMLMWLRRRLAVR